jgi:signal transduction histidine kinase
VTAHSRSVRLNSIRLRLMIPIVLATLGLVALGAAQTETAVRSAVDARRGQAVAATALAALRLNNLLEQEISEGDDLRARSGQASALLTGAIEQTDRAVADFRTAAAGTRELSPSLGGVLDVALAQIDTLATLRARATQLDATSTGADLYSGLRNSVLGVADALPATLTDVGLAATARAVAAIARAEHYAGQQRDLLRRALIRGAFAPGEQAELDRLVGAQDERIAEFDRDATPTQQAVYARDFVGPDVNTALGMRSAVLQPQPSAAALHADPDAWYIAQSNLIRRLHEVQTDLSHTLDQTAREQQSAAGNRAALTGLSTGVLILLAFGAALLFAVRTARRLRRLRRAALRVAGSELPDTITELTDASDQATIRKVLNDATGRAEILAVAGSDEVGEVGAALSTLHRQALRLAADQASLRQDVAGMFIALSRRGQTLIARQLQLIAEFENLETDRTTLQRLFSLGHLATRMRRNEENLLVLAGGEVGVRVLAPVPLIEVIRAAATEIEDYHRVDAAGVAEVAIAAHVVRDVVHLLAELLENATGFAPPTSRVRVTARRAVDNVTVTIFDDGIGMQAEQVAQLNARLARPSRLTAELAGTMGLLVVARLAHRHRITVELRSAAGGGTAALVALPLGILAPMPSPVSPSPFGSDRAGDGPIRATVIPATPLPAVGPAAMTLGGPAAVPAGALVGGPARAQSDLPRRRPGDLLVPGAVNGPGTRYGFDDDPSRPPDPEVTRARLGGLASGLAAAARMTRPPS